MVEASTASPAPSLPLFHPPQANTQYSVRIALPLGLRQLHVSFLFLLFQLLKLVISQEVALRQRKVLSIPTQTALLFQVYLSEGEREPYEC